MSAKSPYPKTHTCPSVVANREQENEYSVHEHQQYKFIMMNLLGLSLKM